MSDTEKNSNLRGSFPTVFFKFLVPVAFTALLLYLLAFTQKNAEELNELHKSLSAYEESIANVNHLSDKIKNLETSTVSDISAAVSRNADEIVTNKLKAFTEDLKILQKKIMDAQKNYSSIIANKERALKDLPGLVHLDDLANLYMSRLKAADNILTVIVSFDTGSGKISFTRDEVQLAYVPSTKQIASIRIGETQSNVSNEIIATWIDEARKAKVNQGYKSLGEKAVGRQPWHAISEQLVNGDNYFSYYFKPIRVVQESGATYTAYEYFIEVGSLKRKKRLALEQYNSQLGS